MNIIDILLALALSIIVAFLVSGWFYFLGFFGIGYFGQALYRYLIE